MMVGEIFQIAAHPHLSCRRREGIDQTEAESNLEVFGNTKDALDLFLRGLPVQDVYNVKAKRQGMSHQPRVFESTAQSNHVSGL